ncbi:hypothetical protein GCM10008014_30230 [Paenibacillus silvae]|uniref:Glycosyltransferase 2-like domain-containing protein n=1 Tax=Paenibacillus silvae TaxID=1325358 RepID=A0ABQ1ZFX3_9BACL|nr:glycosyltransferase [Paenibacillus silvae]GGH58024.1 hypothetical protein GCM10008014_30230 [Paenibacillus silvae]
MDFVNITPPQNPSDEVFLQNAHKLIKQGSNVRVENWGIEDFDRLGGFFEWANFSYILNEIPDISPSKSSLTACILTYNCESSIEHCLINARRYADQIIIIDSESQDKTRKIVKQYTNNIFTVPNHIGFDEKRNLAIEKANTDWIMMIDSDEAFPENGDVNIRKLMAWADIKEIEIFWFSRFWLIRDQISPLICRKGHLALWPDPQARLMKKSINPKYVNSLHEHLKSDHAKFACLVNDPQTTILHFKYWLYSDLDLEHLLGQRQEINPEGPDDVQLLTHSKYSYTQKLPLLRITEETRVFLHAMTEQ